MVVVLLALIAIGVLEIFVFAQVVDAIGWANALGLLIVISLVGVWLVKRAGWKVWQRVNQQLARGRVPQADAIDGGLVLLAGGLLVIPGFVTDVAGLLLLFPPVRGLVRRQVQRRMQVRVEQVRATYRGRIYDARSDGTYETTASEQPPGAPGGPVELPGPQPGRPPGATPPDAGGASDPSRPEGEPEL
jgi:UPF0716 protein FxsA